VSQATLGDVLYPDRSKSRPLEQEWVGLARDAGRGDTAALLALYENAHRPIFTLAMRITGNRRSAEDVTLAVFDHVRRHGADYRVADGTVLAWLMNLTRARAIGRADRDDVRAARVRRQTLEAAFAALLPGQREALETAFFSRRAAMDARVRPGLHNLGRALAQLEGREWPEYPNRCDEAELVCAHLLQALPAEHGRAIEAHLLLCGECRREVGVLRPVLDSLVAWPIDVLRPTRPLQHVLRISAGAKASADTPQRRPEPEWEDVAPGIAVQILASDPERHIVSMLVRLVPGGEYPAHTHAGVEELHLLDGELWIEERKLHPGDYNRAEPGTGDKRVYSETGCTCVLVTSTRDELG
jgi:DNA-directed RNA polymerase specialized sigma24 family protein